MTARSVRRAWVRSARRAWVRSARRALASVGAPGVGFGRRAGRWLRSARRRLGSFGGEFALIQIVKERSKEVLPGSSSNSEWILSWENATESPSRFHEDPADD